MMVNVKMVRKLQKFLLKKKGATYCQDWWLFGKKSAVVLEQKPPCGTAGCLAGNAVLMEGYVPYNPYNDAEASIFSFVKKSNDRFSSYVETLAMELLGLNRRQADWLFDPNCNGWPKEYKMSYRNAKTPLQRAKAACKTLDFLIKTDLEARKSTQKEK